MTVLIAGAGPAGSRLAIRLAGAGFDVVLADRLEAPVRNAFSSAALPLRDADRLSIPRSCRSAEWLGWQLVDPMALEHQWWADQTLGVVLDFGLLRTALWQEARQAGVELLSGCKVSVENLDQSQASLSLTFRNGQRQKREVRWLIDATGARRDLLHQTGVSTSLENDPLLNGFGAEWLIQADDHQSARWRDRITFFLGTRWIPHGYGWVFPMGNHQLKVGVCRLIPPDLQQHSWGLSRFLVETLRFCGLEGCPVLDRHGGAVVSSVSRREPHGAGALLAVGDAASSANLLGGEGIRHAFDSADQLAEVLIEHGTTHGMTVSETVRSQYKKQQHQRWGWRWGVSGRLARRTWYGLKDDRADQRLSRLISGLSTSASAEVLSELLFGYQFERYGLRLLPYLI